MTYPKVILLDADGVLIRNPGFFSDIYAKQHGIDPDQIEPFFDAEFRRATVGKADLKELIRKRRDLWKWTASQMNY